MASDSAADDILANILRTYFAERIGELEERYMWKIPDKLPDGIVLEGKTLAVQTIELRKKIAARLRHRKREIDDLTFIVREWGQIHKIKDEKIASYADFDGSRIAKIKLDGVASWSKILAFSEPDKYAILDARVSAAITALLIQNGHRSGFFPILPSRNPEISKFLNCVDCRFEPHAFRDGVGLYAIYCDILKRATSGLGADHLARGEMLLFANAVTLALEARKMIRPS